MKRNNLKGKELLSAREAAIVLNVTPQTIKNYIYSGRLKSVKTPGGQHRIRRSDLNSLGFSSTNNKEGEVIEQDYLDQLYNQLFQNYLETIKVLLTSIDSRNCITSGHSIRVSEYATILGKRLKMPEKQIQNLQLAALLHDVGKLEISEDIICKTTKLTNDETLIIKKHPEIGEKMVEEVNFLRPIKGHIRHHHERFDGKGYPDGLVGNSIELEARIIALADAFDYMKSDVPNRKAMPMDICIKEIKKGSGTQFDPQIAKVFISHPPQTS
jgi:excisionase family DNA binding protein/putative nucleotidyltransferase with HDIG domain